METMVEEGHSEDIIQLNSINLTSYERYADFLSEISYESANIELQFEGNCQLVSQIDR